MTDGSKTKGQALKALRKLMSQTPRPSGHETPGEIFHFGIFPPGFLTGELKPRRQDDRSIALVLAAALDQALEGALLRKMPAVAPGQEAFLFTDEGAPLNSLHAKIALALALGVIGPGAHADLMVIKHVRNAFAHSRLRLSFDTPEIAEACHHFDLKRRWPGGLKAVPDHAREVFINVGFQYGLYLIGPGGEEPGEVRRKVLDLLN